MDDVVDSRGREVMLPGGDYSGSSACSNVNMTSVDSGIEIGNDSNDSSTVQQETVQQQQAASQVSSDVAAVDFSREFPKLDKKNMYNNWCKSLMHPLFPTDSEIKRDSSEVAMLLQRDAHKTSELSSNFCYRKIREHMLRSRRKGTHTFAFNSWKTESDQRRMRLAATTNNISLMKRLLEFGVSPNSHDEHGRTPLHISACRGYAEIVCLLLENGADPNQRDCVGNTPLHLATVTNRLSVMMPLLTAGTDVLALDSYGYNPLQLAKTKLKMLQQNCNSEDMLKVKEEMHNVIKMLMTYLQKQKNMREQVETLSNFCSRLSLSNTSNQVQDDVKDLLANINALSITG